MSIAAMLVGASPAMAHPGPHAHLSETAYSVHIIGHVLPALGALAILFSALLVYRLVLAKAGSKR